MAIENRIVKWGLYAPPIKVTLSFDQDISNIVLFGRSNWIPASRYDLNGRVTMTHQDFYCFDREQTFSNLQHALQDEQRYLIMTDDDLILMQIRLLVKRGDVKSDDLIVFFISDDGQEVHQTRIGADGKIEYPAFASSYLDKLLSELL